MQSVRQNVKFIYYWGNTSLEFKSQVKKAITNIYATDINVYSSKEDLYLTMRIHNEYT